MSGVEPFIRWAGGKTWLIKTLNPIIEKLRYSDYYEPFLGGAAVFFSVTHPHSSFLSDTNQDLINTYTAVRDMPQLVIQYLRSYQNTLENYYRVRLMEPDNLAERAARFIYLNQTSFNGLYRVNRQGRYNVPYGYRSNWPYNYDRLICASQKLQEVNLNCGDFEVNKSLIKERDLIFLDPPYTVSHNNNGFIQYNQNLFSIDDQYRLSKYIDYVKSKGAFYILTNAAHPIIKEIFCKDGDCILELDRKSLIGGKLAERKLVSEYIFTNILKEV